MKIKNLEIYLTILATFIAIISLFLPIFSTNVEALGITKTIKFNGLDVIKSIFTNNHLNGIMINWKNSSKIFMYDIVNILYFIIIIMSVVLLGFSLYKLFINKKINEKYFIIIILVVAIFNILFAMASFIFMSQSNLNNIIANSKTSLSLITYLMIISIFIYGYTAFYDNNN